MIGRPTGDDRQRWNRRYAAGGTPDEPARFLVDRAGLLPTTGRALDVAGGAGRNACWLARRGLTVTLVDVADEACRLAARHAEEAGLHLDVLRADLTVAEVPAGPWDVILCHHFLDRDLLHRLPGHLAARGVLLFAQPTVRNLERHERPGRAWLLATGEVAALARALTSISPDQDLEVVEATEGWTGDGRHEAHLVVRRR